MVQVSRGSRPNQTGSSRQWREQRTGSGRLVRGELENGEHRAGRRLRLDKSASDAALEVVDLLIKVHRQSSQPSYPRDRISISSNDGCFCCVVGGIEKTIPVVEGNTRCIETCRLDPHAESPVKQLASQGLFASLG